MNEKLVSNIRKRIDHLSKLEKIYNATLDMQSKVRMNEDHVYKTTDDNGTWLQGVTTVSSIVPKDWLSAWGAKEAVKFLGYSDYEGDTQLATETLKKISKFKTPEEFIALLKEAKGASGRKSKTALVDGKAGHAWLEEYVKSKIEGTKPSKTPTDALKRPVEQFLEWEMENISSWVLSEALVAYPEKGYAGTLDALAFTKSGKLALVDFKFASHISDEFYLQTAAYCMTFEPYGIEIDERIIVRLPKTLLKEEWDDKVKKYKMVDNNIEVETVKTVYEADKIAFLHALPLKGWINSVVKNQFKK